MRKLAHTLGVLYALEKLGALSPEWAARIRQLEAQGGVGGQTFSQFQAAQRGPVGGPDPFAAMRPRQQHVARVLGNQPLTGAKGDVYLEALSPSTRARMAAGQQIPFESLSAEAHRRSRAAMPKLFEQLGPSGYVESPTVQQQRVPPTPSATPARVRHLESITGREPTLLKNVSPAAFEKTVAAPAARAGTEITRAAKPGAMQKLRTLVTGARRLAHV